MARLEQGTAAPPRAARAADRALALCALAASGALALVYELCWVRAFASTLGSSGPSLALTVSAALLGFALGSAFFGRRAVRWRRPWRAYALLEVAAGLAALWVLLLRTGFERIAPGLEAALEGQPAPLLLLRGALVAAAILPACFLLGGTLPALTQALDDGRGGGGLESGRLYAASTLGAVAGALAFPFALLPALGAPLTYRAAVAGSILLGALVYLLRGSHTVRGSAAAPQEIPIRVPERRLLFLAAGSGLATMALELVWARMLAQVHHSAIHAFALVLALFLLALGLGAAGAAALVRRGFDPGRILGAAWLAGGLATLAAAPIFLWATDGLDYLSAESPGEYLRALLGLGALTFLLPSLCAGAALPLLFALATRGGGAAAAPVGGLLAANGAGAVAGPLLATWVLFPLLGMWGSTLLLGSLLAGLGLFAARAAGAAVLPRALLFLLAALPLGWIALEAPRVRLDRGQGEELLWIAEGAHGIVSVIRDPGGLRLALDGSYTLGGSRSSGDERLLGHLPLLVHGAPRRVAFLGLGTGITASAAPFHDPQAVVVFELVPEVARAAREHFAPFNLGLLDDPRVRLVQGDARSHLRAHQGSFDVIVGDLVVPWRRGEAALHTRESFAIARRALAPGGLYCQWLPLFQMTEEELCIVAATFLDVFGSATLWRGDFVAAQPTLALIGALDEAPLDPVALDARLIALAPRLADDQRYLAHPAGLWLHLVGELAATDPWLAGVALNTEAHPRLELLSARTHFPGRAVARSLLVGGGLSRFLQRFEPFAPESHGPLRALDPSHVRWRALGAQLFEASCLAAEGDARRAQELAFRALAELPEPIQRRILGQGPDGQQR